VFLLHSLRKTYNLQSTDLLSANQSGFRPGHSTETAVLRVLSDILLAVNRGDVAALILLDLSAAFDTVYYEILLQCLQITYGISDVAHRWFRSYCLAGRNTYELGPRARPSSTSSAVFLRDESLVRFCSYCTLPA